MAYSGKFRPVNPQKYVGNPTNIVYRSTWECMYMSRLDKNPNVLKWASEEVVVPYKDPVMGHNRRYFVDFWVKYSDVTLLVEIKPKYQTLPPVKKSRITKKYVDQIHTYAVNQAKWAAAREFCRRQGWGFQILTEDDLGIRP